MTIGGEEHRDPVVVVLPDPQDRWLAPSEHRLRAFDAETSDVHARDLTDVNAVDDQLRPPTDVLEPRDQARGRVSRRTERGVLSDPDGLPLRRLIDDVASSNAVRHAVEARRQIGGQGTDDQVLRAAIVDESAVGPHGVSDDRHLGVGPWGRRIPTGVAVANRRKPYDDHCGDRGGQAEAHDHPDAAGSLRRTS